MSSRFLTPSLPGAPPRSSRTRPPRSSPRPRPARPPPAARSSSSAKKREIAAASAVGSPGGTRSPFSPSFTTSGTPPTAVAMTGHPTASASTTVCGKFSHADGTRTRRRRGTAAAPARGTAVTNDTRVSSPSSRPTLERGTLGPSPATTSVAPGPRTSALKQARRAPSAPEATGEDECAPRIRARGELVARRHRRNLGGRIGQNRDATRIEPPAQRDVAQVRARAEDVTRAAERPVARRAQEPRPHAAGDVLELVERSDVAPLARGALEDLVGHELHDQRPPGEAGADRRAADHARRVDDLRAPPPGARAAQRERAGGESDATPRARGTPAAPARPPPSSPPRRRGRARPGSPRARAHGSQARPDRAARMPETTTTSRLQRHLAPGSRRTPRPAGAGSRPARRPRRRGSTPARRPRLPSRPTPPRAPRRAGSPRAPRARA